jgi:hypothetical protein
MGVWIEIAAAVAADADGGWPSLPEVVVAAAAVFVVAVVAADAAAVEVSACVAGTDWLTAVVASDDQGTVDAADSWDSDRDPASEWAQQQAAEGEEGELSTKPSSIDSWPVRRWEALRRLTDADYLHHAWTF